MVLHHQFPSTRGCIQANLTDYSLERPEGSRAFFAYITFADGSRLLWDRIYTASRREANLGILARFEDCLDDIKEITVYDDDF